MRDVPEEELYFTPAKVNDNLEINEKDIGSFGSVGVGLTFVFWNCIAFLCSVVLCSVVRNVLFALLKRYFERL